MIVATGFGPVSDSMVSSTAIWFFSPANGEHTGCAPHTGRPGRREPSDTLFSPFSYTAMAERVPTLKTAVKKGRQLMQVQVNTSNGVENKDTLERWAGEFLNDALARFRQEITRVEVQMSDENSLAKGAADMRCMLEARLNGHEPLVVSHHAETQDLAFRGAAQKLVRLIEHTLGKLDRHEHRARETIRKDPSIVE